MCWGVYSEFLKCNICFNDQRQNISSANMILKKPRWQKNYHDHQRMTYTTKCELKNKKYKQVLLDIHLNRTIIMVKCIFFIIFPSYQLVLSH